MLTGRKDESYFYIDQVTKPQGLYRNRLVEDYSPHQNVNNRFECISSTADFNGILQCPEQLFTKLTLVFVSCSRNEGGNNEV